ncbi:hypothetical protein [Acidovorax sp. Root267]|uniref:hypothetical protein n=1 Tax=Acidovorax sp. Root267 TaxID=1736505 RepID=UPI001124FDAF|nr:hypothetical protein [Acidovorax sp. Root267]
MLFRLQPRSLKDFANAGLVNVLINTAGQRDVGGMLFRLQPRSLKDFANAGLVNVLINKDRSFPASVKP